MSKQMTKDELDVALGNLMGYKQYMLTNGFRGPYLMKPMTKPELHGWRDATESECVALPRFSECSFVHSMAGAQELVLAITENTDEEGTVEMIGAKGQWECSMDSTVRHAHAVEATWEQAICCSYYQFRTGTRVELVADNK